MSDLTEAELKAALMRADLYLKTRQSFWENGRNMAIIIGTIAAILAAVFGVLGYKLGSQPPQSINVHLDQPITVRVLPP